MGFVFNLVHCELHTSNIVLTLKIKVKFLKTKIILQLCSKLFINNEIITICKLKLDKFYN